MAMGVRQLHIIVLTEQEQQIFERLLRVVDHFGLDTQLRVAGGWVRDKLLGEDSSDIDIALDITGQKFVKMYLEFMDEEQKTVGVSQWYAICITLIRKFGRLLDHFNLGTQLLIARGWATHKLFGRDSGNIDVTLDNMTGQRKVKYSKLMDEKQKEASSKKKKKGHGVIPCNPDKSKHLETAKLNISGIDIDFVNLRSETYAENSSIPAMEIGMAKDDAFRRDLTINSLFYNINTQIVEDLTEKGLEDLKNGLIATPLSAKATFLDDPLRVLRAIRFAARFSFTLAEDLKEAASDENVKSDLCRKISKDRIRDEVDHMMSGNHPVNAMCYIRDLGLFYVVFEFPEKLDPPVLDKHDWLCVSHMEAAWNLAQLIGFSVVRGGSDSMSQKRLCLYSALFTPVRNMVYMDEKSEKVPVVRYITEESLKMKTRDSKMIRDVHAASEKFAELIFVLDSNGNVETVREKLNDEYLEIPTDLVKRVLAGLEDVLFKKGLEDGVWMVELLLDGVDIQRVLDIGTLVERWKQRVLKWQLAHPEGTKEECEEWMKLSQQPKHQKLEM